MDQKTPLIVLTGPTGAGKTAIAIKLALSYPIDVISADSMQVYRYMDIATAKPGRKELSVLPHHLIDIVDPDEDFNAGMFADLAGRQITELRLHGRIPIVVGGTGLYIKSLVYGLIPAPAKSEKLRSYLRTLSREKGMWFLWHFLAMLDPASVQKITPNDSARIFRYLEIIFLSGIRPSGLQGRHGFAEPAYSVHTVCIMPDRQRLYHSIDRRVYDMIDQGLVDETKGLLERGYTPALRSMQTLAYKHVIRYLNSELSLDEAVSLIQRDTRHYAKRQITWIRSHHEQDCYYNAEKAVQVISHLIDEIYRTS
ncbi:MAG TPA: tRNA (adenosine(37)-N6)-dimethylallyltransferase MiaA [Deltaproteobacteria bacterium]|nr:tRNA (adenosine(37)-N6)-dimethylallyltransferase MiaA [Deltaproteobacteria bacterium]